LPIDAGPKPGHTLLSVSVLTVEVELFLERYAIFGGHDAVPQKKKQTAAQFALSFEKHGLRH
jgi:hypothetical protein